MLRKLTILSLLLTCVMLLNGCLPGTYVSRAPSAGMVVDAVTGLPLPDVKVSYEGEDQLTSNSGDFNFSKQTSLTIYFLGGEGWRSRPSYLSFEKSGYASRTLSLSEIAFYEKGSVRLEPSLLPTAIAGLDKNISSVLVRHSANGRLLVVFEIKWREELETMHKLAQTTKEISEKLLKSKLAGDTPDVAFCILRPIYNWCTTSRWNGVEKQNYLSKEQIELLENPAFAKKVAGVDKKISGVYFSYTSKNDCWLSFTVTYPEEYGSEAEMGKDAQAISDKVNSLLPIGTEHGTTTIEKIPGERYAWILFAGWSSETLGKLNMAKTSKAEWLNSATFAKFSPRDQNTKLTKDKKNEKNEKNENDAYEIFIDKASSSEAMPEIFRREDLY